MYYIFLIVRIADNPALGKRMIWILFPVNPAFSPVKLKTFLKLLDPSLNVKNYLQSMQAGW